MKGGRPWRRAGEGGLTRFLQVAEDEVVNLVRVDGGAQRLRPHREVQLDASASTVLTKLWSSGGGRRSGAPTP